MKRNLKSIDILLDQHPYFPLNKKYHKYLPVLHTLYDQQYTMFTEDSPRVEQRIVSIHLFLLFQQGTFMNSF